MATAEISESVFHATTPAMCVDEYYPSEETNKMQCYATVVDNRFKLALPSQSFGSSSTVIYNPDQGLGDIVMTLVLPAPDLSGTLTYANWALPRGWGSQFIRQIGLRIGGSSLYYFTQDQLEILTFEDCEDSQKRDAVWALAGSEILSAAGFASAQARTANVYIRLPFNTISALQKTLPLPTDLLTQPLNILVEFNSADKVFFPCSNGATQASAANLPNKFESATIQFKQTHMLDSGKLLARRVNMNEKALSYPLRSFAQTTYRTGVSLRAGSTDVNINLTGFRAGSVKWIDIWALQTADASGNAVNVGNGRNYSRITGARLSVNGLVYYDSEKDNSQLWSLCDMKTPAYVNNTFLTDTTTGSATASSVATPWLRVPFSQVAEVLANESNITLGLPIQNSVVNLTLTLPANGDYIISASYNYVSNLLFTRGSCEYIF